MKPLQHLLLFATGLACLPSVAVAAPASDYVPMKVIQTEAVNYPRRATELGIKEGEVHVALQIDSDGALADYLVTAYTHPFFAESAVQALKKWKFEPARVGGQPRGATVELAFDYESRGLVVVNLNVSTYVEIRDIQLRPGAYEYRACTLRQLDRIPTPSKVVPPVYRHNPNQQQPAVVTVYFYIDEKGQVRLPAVNRETSESNDELAAAAVNAVAQWQFEPPLSKGQPVLVAARQDFRFPGAGR